MAQHLGIQVAYLSGLTMRRVADMHPGQAKTDARDAYIIETARTMPHTAAGHRSRRTDCRSADAVWV
ncbi:MAG TPA: IS110 family transposase [Candidatus Yaniella excrementigallinarum]|nr:IS110 family transposase [Candidatus Yaniella excrementigallinarum]